MYKFLSYPLDPEDLCWPGEPVLRTRICTEIGEDSACMTGESVLPDHFGTHFDAPAHFHKGALKIAELPAEYFVHEKVLLLDVPKRPEEGVMPEDLKPQEEAIKGCTLLLLRTGFFQVKRKDPKVYQCQGPFLHPDTCEYLVKTFPGLRTVGFDFLSVGSPCNDLSTQAHQMLLGCHTEHYITAVEDMDLSAIGDRAIRQVTIAPLRVVGMDSGQVCVIGDLEDC